MTIDSELSNPQIVSVIVILSPFPFILTNAKSRR